MKTQARVVVIGGGIVGCSTLYHLTKLGWSDVVLVERDELTSGSTWHAAGNVPVFSGGWNVIKMQRYSAELYSRLGAEVDYPIAYHQSGSVRLAHSRDRMDEFRHIAEMAQAQGVEFEILDLAGLKERYPLIEVHDLAGALWDPLDGDIDPSQVTQALAKGARDGGAEIQRFNPVEAIERTAGGEWLVKTKDGDITAEIVVNAAGYRAAEVGAMVGLDLPIVSMEHQYLVTDTVADVAARTERLPLLRDPDDSYYLRQEGDGLLLGPYEWQATPAWLDGIPADFGMELYADDLERLEAYIENACARVPALATGGVQRVVNGPIPYTPDGLPLIGPAFDLDNFFLCAAFSFGIAQGGGAGKIAAEMIVEGESEWDMWPLDPRRYTDHANQAYTVAKAVELYQNEYAIAFPFNEWPAGRPAKTSPLYDILKAKGANFGARNGWERATWFPPADADAAVPASFRRAGWFGAVAEECKAVRQRVGILDLGGFAKYEVTGPGATDFLDGLIAGPMPSVGRISLSYMLTHKGGILSETTITRLEDDRYFLCSAGAAEWHDYQWMRQHLPDDGSVGLTNVTARFGTLILAGPKARDVLGRITSADLSSDAFPWLSAQPIEVGFSSMLALRINYVGELGWELHIPVENMVAVYEALMEAGAESGITDFGMYAMESLRLEKCYRSWKVDLTQEYTPLEASLDRFIRLNKTGFIGREALLAQQQEGLTQRLVPLIVDADDADAPACAGVFQNGERVGLVTSGGYGHALGHSIALAYVRPDLTEPGTALEVEILGDRRPAVVATEPLYDPDNARLKA
jgi:dimethylglycine dehydrogenase